VAALAAIDAWSAAVKAASSGYLGSTAGVTADGSFVALVRFESEQASRAESRAWWTDHLSSAAVIDCPDVTFLYGGGSDDAGYVQVMSGHTANPARFKEISRRFEDYLPSSRPEILGGLTAFASDGRFFNVVYFTSQAAARAGEKEPRPPEIDALFAEFDQQMDEYLDLAEPWFDSA
jgi:hypothetical protein